MERSDTLYVVGYCHPGFVHAGWAESMMGLQRYDAGAHQRLQGVIGWQSSANVAQARNKIVEMFLAKTDAPWLLMVDTDMVFPADAVDRLLARADGTDHRIIGGMCYGIDDSTVFPTMYDIAGTVDDPQVVRYQSWPEGSLFPVFATGAAFLLIHREVLEAVREKEFNRVFPWFQETTYPPGPSGVMPMSEDITFCLRAQMAKYGVVVDTAVHIGHVKPRVVTHSTYQSQQEMACQQD